jgi:integrase/recombinase XerD
MIFVLRSFVIGPLESYVSGVRRGVGQTGLYGQRRVAASVFRRASGPLDACRALGVRDLSGPVIDRYLAQLRAAGYVHYRSAKAMRPLLGYLAPLGVRPSAPPVVLDPVEEMLECFRWFLSSSAG